MSHVLVTADFPGVTASQRDEIYECLKKKHWIKIEEFGRDISTVWRARFDSTVQCDQAIGGAIAHFVECSKKYCKVKLVIHCGPSQPTYHGLT